MHGWRIMLMAWNQVNFNVNVNTEKKKFVQEKMTGFFAFFLPMDNFL